LVISFFRDRIGDTNFCFNLFYIRDVMSLILLVFRQLSESVIKAEGVEDASLGRTSSMGGSVARSMSMGKKEDLKRTTTMDTK
jgi:hypothetical protein